MNFNKMILMSAIALLLLYGSWLVGAQSRTPALISLNAAGDDSGNTDSYLNSSVPRSALSADGRFVVFISEASDLVTNVRDGNFSPDVYVRDLQTGVTELVSVNLTGRASGNNTSANPMISANGRFVAFESAADDLVEGDTNSNRDVFIRDLQTGETKLVTVNTDGIVSRNETLFLNLFGLSNDGRFVLFSSGARDLVSNDNNDSADLYVRDVVAGRTMLVTVNRDGFASGSRSRLTSSGFFNFDAVLSSDGQTVAFASYVNDLVDNDNVCLGRCDGTNGLSDVFVRDLAEGKTELISINSKGTDGGNELSHDPSISDDGQVVAFRSFATNLTDNDRTPQADIYVRSRRTGVTELVSVNLAGANGGTDGRGNGLNSGNHLISPNGRFVAFSSVARDLTPNKTNLLTSDVFVRDLLTGTTTLASVNLKDADSPSDSRNQYVSVAADFSADGRYLVFRSTAPDLSDKDFNGADDLFLRDLIKGETLLVSLNRDASSSGNGRSLTADISANGRVIAFDSDAFDIATNDNNRAPDVFAYKVSDALQPRIVRVQYWPTDRLAITGKDFSADAKLFLNGRELQIAQRHSSLLISEKLLLNNGRYLVQVVNEDGLMSEAPLIIK